MSNSLYRFNHSASVCPPLRQPLNGFLPAHVNTLSSVTVAACYPGFIFPEGKTMKSFECTNQSQWNDSLSNCTGTK